MSKMQRVTSPRVPEPAPGTWSNCRVYGNQFFVAGMTASDGKGGVLGDGSMYSQAKEAFGKIKHMVEAAGGTMNDIARLDIYVSYELEVNVDTSLTPAIDELNTEGPIGVRCQVVAR